MANLVEAILGQLSGEGGLERLGGAIGAEPERAGAASGAAVTALLGALAKNADRSGGAEALDAALQRDHDGSLLDNLGGFLADPSSGSGDGILRHVLGNRRPAVESGLGQATGLERGQVGRLLTALAPVVLAQLGKQKRERGLDARGLAGLLDHERTQLRGRQPQAMDALSGLLDTDGDGDVDMGDLAKHGAGLLGKFLKR